MEGLKISMYSANQLRLELDSLSYDKYYQDIDCLDFKGYSKSSESWAKILDLGVVWSEKTVCDLGCFHGYFAFKIEQMGANRVYGLDQSNLILDFSEKLKSFAKSSVEFRLWRGGETTPECDIALVLNMLHHCPDQRKALENIRCKSAVFEVKDSQIPLISEYFEVVKSVQGRMDPDGTYRKILYAVKK